MSGTRPAPYPTSNVTDREALTGVPEGWSGVSRRERDGRRWSWLRPEADAWRHGRYADASIEHIPEDAAAVREAELAHGCPWQWAGR